MQPYLTLLSFTPRTAFEHSDMGSSSIQVLTYGGSIETFSKRLDPSTEFDVGVV